jgi:sentrin-specific protease 7
LFSEQDGYYSVVYIFSERKASRLLIKCFLCNLQSDIGIVVDYVVYRGKYCTGCLVTFSYSGIKINGTTAHGDEGTFSFETGIDEIVSIESQNIQRVSSSNLMGL